MSSTDYNILISRASGGRGPLNIFGVGIQVVSGYLGLRPDLELERLVTPGVDGVRFREVSRQFEPLTFTTVEPFATHKAAVAQLDKLPLFKGPSVNVLFKFSDAQVRYEGAKITSISARLQGRYFGFGQIANATCSLEYTITVQRMGASDE